MKNLLLITTTLFAAKISAQNVQLFTLKQLPAKPVNELLTRGMISGEQGTIGYFTYKKGAVVPTHHHSNEQYSLITKGSVKVKILDKEISLKLETESSFHRMFRTVLQHWRMIQLTSIFSVRQEKTGSRERIIITKRNRFLLKFYKNNDHLQ
jgi:hypothetical protein